MNGLLFQSFEWHTSGEGNFYNELCEKLDELKKIGVTAIWLPPPFKGTSNLDTGYSAYDIYDLGEFEQKEGFRTKYGTKEELLNLIEEIHKRDMQAYIDAILNHKGGADELEVFKAVEVDGEDRLKEIGEPKDIEGWTSFTFPGRGDKYSSFKWNFNHFSGVDFDNKTGESGIFKILGENKGWSLAVSEEKGNFDYLMFADIDHAHPDVVNDLKNWANWFIGETKADGFRLDAVKHIDRTFMKDYVDFVRNEIREDFLFIGEYWTNDLNETNEFLEDTEFKIDLVDIGLHTNFFHASKGGSNFDLRTIFDNTLVEANSALAVTFVDNHDSQPGQAAESFVESWFKPIAYGIILLRRDGYPTIFSGDYYGIEGEFSQPSQKEIIDKLSIVRKKFAYGEQDDYLENKNLLGWVRHGNEEHPGSLAVAISNGDTKTLKMFVGEDQAGKIFVDHLGNNNDEIIIDNEGYGEFIAPAGSISAWAEMSM